MVFRHGCSAVTRVLLLSIGLNALIASSAFADFFVIEFTQIDSVRRESQNDRVELQILATKTNGTTVNSDWSGQVSIPSLIRVLRVSYLSAKTSEEHSDSILDACQQMTLLAQANPGDYKVSIRIEVPDTSQVIVTGPDSLVGYMHTQGYRFNCLLTRVN